MCPSLTPSPIRKKTKKMRKPSHLPLFALILLLLLPLSLAFAEPLQECHKVQMDKVDTTQANKSVIRIWTVDTVLDSVDDEIRSIEDAYAQRLGPDLPKAGSSANANSRVDVEVRYSRTGLTWMSFVIQARTTYHRDLTGQEITSRTYDMTSGERILLSDIFPLGSDAWQILAQAVRTQLTAYFPKEIPDEGILDELCSVEGLLDAPFSLHGLSLVLHYPAYLLYPGHYTLMEVTLMYPDIRPYMTARAQTETDNLTYYKTVALTFDDGPVRTNSTLVLQSLMTVGCRGTFFVVGNRISAYDDLVQREHDEGHAHGYHNWHHGTVTKSSATALRAMKTKCDTAMLAAIGTIATYDRVPYGLYPEMIKAQVGWPYIQWSLDTYDWRGKSTNAVLSTVKKEIQDGDIILCHDIKDNTPESARQICLTLMERGYMFLTIDELFAKDGVVLEPDTVYFHCVDGDTTIRKN